MLKGTVGSYGFGAIAASLARIEEQLEAGDPGPDWPVVDAALARIDALLGA